MRAALYARVSTVDQNCEMQLRALREYCASRGWDAVEYVDTGWSGSKASRPELDRLLKDASLHKFDVVIVWKLDRFGRSVSHLLKGIDALRQWGVRFIALTQNIDTDEQNPMSRFLLVILSAVAELEREMIRERVKAGINNARLKGRTWGRNPRVFDRDRMVRLRDEGRSYREIGRDLGIGKTTVARELKIRLKPLENGGPQTL